ncbi:Dual specificity/tyrosine protein phosphatase, N-terminal [Phytophthora cactorum]|nr:Dual specificity/tyrosine protein phosphatase, N-terminal [Phytophthora cactorum]
MASSASTTLKGARNLSAELYDRVELLPGKLDFALLSSTQLKMPHSIIAKKRNSSAWMETWSTLVVAGGLTPELAVTRVLNDGKLLPPFGFRDASCGVCTFFITLLDCARAVHKAITSSIWSYQTFSVEEYDHLDSLENGDINWIVPGKLIAFSGLQRERIVLDAESGATTLLAKDYAALFRDINVTCVIRFNEFTTYDRKAFIHAGLRHIDMPFRTAATQATKSSTSSSAYECLNLQPLFLHRSSLLCAFPCCRYASARLELWPSIAKLVWVAQVHQSPRFS